MTDQEKSFKKRWLILFALIVFLSAIRSYFNLERNVANLGLSSSMLLFCMGIVILSAIGYFYILYRCAYIKPGTRFLTFILFLIPFSWIYTAIFWSQSDGTVEIFYPWPLVFPLYALLIWWYILSWKVRSLNKRLQQKK